MNKKIFYIASAQLIGCLFVIFGHSYPFNVNIPKFLDNLRIFIYCFHIPLFVYISGNLLIKSDSIAKYGSIAFIKRRAVKLLIPYFVLSLIAIIPKYLLRNYINDDFNLTFNHIIRAFFVPRENIWGHFWFIPMIFFLAVISIMIVKVIKDRYINWLLVLISILFLFLPPITGWFSLNDIKNHLFYYILGMIVASYPELEKRWVENRMSLFGLPIAIVLFLLMKFNSIASITIMIKLFIALMMILFILSLCNFVHFENFKFFSFNYPHIYSIFILSWLFQVAIEILFNRILNFPVYLVMILMFLSGIVLPILFIYMVKFIEKNSKNKILSLIIGL